MPRDTKICPDCGSARVLKIVYGLPSSELMESVKREQVKLGGCMVGFNDPTKACLDCEYEWGHRIEPLLEEMVRFEASVGGFFGPSYTFIADCRTGQYTYEKSTEAIYEILEKAENLFDRDKLIKGLYSCDFPYWRDCYVDDTVRDGTQWHVEAQFVSGESMKKSGSNRYPGKWESFCRLISQLTGREYH